MIININLIGPNGARCKKVELDSSSATLFLNKYMEQLEASFHPVTTETTEEVTIKVTMQDDIHVASAAELFDSDILSVEE